MRDSLRVPQFLLRLVAPHPTLATSELRRKARLFAFLMLVHMGVVVVALLGINQIVLAGKGRTIWNDLDAWVTVGGVAAIGVAYLLLKAGLLRTGVTLYILITAAVALVAPFVPDPEAEIGMLASAVIPVILTSVAFSNRAALGVLAGILTVGFAELALADAPEVRTMTGFAILAVVLVTGALVLVFRSQMAALERDRLGQIMQSEEATRATQERYQQLFETVGDGIFVADRDGRLIEVNQGACAQLGFSRAELLEKSLKEIVLRTTPGLGTVMQEVLRNGRACFESQHLRKDGVAVPVEVIVTRIQYQGRPAFLGIARDLTERNRTLAERVRLEQQLQQAVKMESIGRLAGGIAHDFNNMLSAILGNAELAMNMVEPEAIVHSFLSDIRKAAESAVALTRQLLAFSRKQILSPRDVVLEELVAQLRKMLLRLIGEDVQLELVSDGRRGMVHVDPTQVEQIIFNLAVNARDAMPSGGRLTLETANCTLDADYSAQHPGVAPGEYVLLATSDTGTGMTAEVKAHLFEPFFTTKPVDQGTGLGLATTYGAVRQSSGHIDVCSEVGRGTTFKVYFPRVVPSAEPAEAPSPPPTLRFGAETVLAVEDDPVVLDLTVRMLRQLGYVVLPAGSPAEALELAKKHHEVIHLLMTDMVMPGLNGRQLVESFLNFHPETKALFTSGYSEDVIAHHGVADAGLDFIGKPYTMQALGDKVRAVLDASAPR